MSKVFFNVPDFAVPDTPTTAQPTTARTEDTVNTDTDSEVESGSESEGQGESQSEVKSSTGSEPATEDSESEEPDSAFPDGRSGTNQKSGHTYGKSERSRNLEQKQQPKSKQTSESKNETDKEGASSNSPTTSTEGDVSQESSAVENSESDSEEAALSSDDSFEGDKRISPPSFAGREKEPSHDSKRAKKDAKRSTTPTDPPTASAVPPEPPKKDKRNRDSERTRLKLTERPSDVHAASKTSRRSGRGEKPTGTSEEKTSEDPRERHKKREDRERSSGSKFAEPATETGRRREPSKRNMQQNMIRYASLYLVPVLLSIPISLLLSLNVILLTPLYNSIPLKLHSTSLYAVYIIPPSVIYWYMTFSVSAKDRISARVCFSLAALSGDLVAVCGRRVGSALGHLLGPEWGAWAARAVLGVGVVGGGLGFALLCFDHISPIAPAVKVAERPRNLGSTLYRAAFFVAHTWLGERLWASYLSNGVSILIQSPEKTILFISLLLTVLSLFLRPGSSPVTFSAQVHTSLTRSMKLSPKGASNLSRLTSLLPAQAFPILLLLRIPLLILALRQQIFLRPPSHIPYITANGELRVLRSERSLTGQIVVGENLKDGYRFLRCDHSILGGRWIREVDDKSAVGGKRTEMGDSIFATFNLQEIAVLAHRSDPNESLIKTLSLTTDLEVTLDGEDDQEDKEPERALIIGLGAGVAATTLSRRGLYVDIVEIDPTVYLAAHDLFDLSKFPITSTNILDGSSFVNQLATLKKDNAAQVLARSIARENEIDSDVEPEFDDEQNQSLVPMWDYVIQDCFTGGSVPSEMFTSDFWEDLGEVVKDDGIVAMNFAGILKSKASRAVLVTLLSVFSQCRAFGDGFEKDQGPNDLVNMVVFCTKTYSPLLTFRPPTRLDALRSPLRSHVYSTFHLHEIQLDTIVSEKDLSDPELMLRRGKSELDKWQVGSAMGTWRAMQKILTPEMWLAY